MLTPHQSRLAEQASNEMDSGKLMHLIAELCNAFDSEREENRQSRRGCAEDCREYEPPLRTTSGGLTVVPKCVHPPPPPAI
jgi:hypothetical protein